MSEKKETLLEFPCEFPIKAFGKDRASFQDTVYEIVSAHVPELKHTDLKANSSSGGRYLAVTATITAQSQAQLDAIYQALTDHDQVIMAL